MKTYWSTPGCTGDWSFRTYTHEDRCMCFQDDYVSKFDIGHGSGCTRMQLEHHEGRQREMIEVFRTFWDCDHDNPFSYEENENYERFGHCEDRGFNFHHGDLSYRSFKANRVPWFSWFAAYTPIGENDMADLYYSMEECEGKHVFAIAVKDYYNKALVFPNAMRLEPGDCPGRVCLEPLPNREGRGSVTRGCGVQPWPAYDYSFIVVVIGTSLCCLCPICFCYLICSTALGIVVFLRMTKFPEEDRDREEVIIIDNSKQVGLRNKRGKKKKKKKKKMSKKTRKMMKKLNAGYEREDDNEFFGATEDFTDGESEDDSVYAGASGSFIYDYTNSGEDSSQNNPYDSSLYDTSESIRYDSSENPYSDY